MSSAINYLRILNDAKCNNCGYVGYDADFEGIDFYKIDNFTTEYKFIYTCPTCKSKDTMELINEA